MSMRSCLRWTTTPARLGGCCLIQFDAVRVEQVGRVEEAVLGCHLFGSRTVLLGHARVGTVREEEAQDEQVTVCGGEMQRGRACPSLVCASVVLDDFPETVCLRDDSPRVPTDCPLDLVPSRVNLRDKRGLLTSAPASTSMRTTVSFPDEAAAWIGKTPSRTELTGWPFASAYCTRPGWEQGSGSGLGESTW